VGTAKLNIPVCTLPLVAASNACPTIKDPDRAVVKYPEVVTVSAAPFTIAALAVYLLILVGFNRR